MVFYRCLDGRFEVDSRLGLDKPSNNGGTEYWADQAIAGARPGRGIRAHAGAEPSRKALWLHRGLRSHHGSLSAIITIIFRFFGIRLIRDASPPLSTSSPAPSSLRGSRYSLRLGPGGICRGKPSRYAAARITSQVPPRVSARASFWPTAMWSICRKRGSAATSIAKPAAATTLRK